jgi:hypothetical protein
MGHIKVKDENSRIRIPGISQRHGSPDPDPDPDPHQNAMDPQHWFLPLQVLRIHDILSVDPDPDPRIHAFD